MRRPRRPLAYLIVGLVLGIAAGVTISPVVEHLMVAAMKTDRMVAGGAS